MYLMCMNGESGAMYLVGGMGNLRLNKTASIYHVRAK